ncbi:MAG: hypothetical protein KDB72_19960 [Mycobacterium sp.]|nr:hypothetical protein [Mycobacterium sp.]
MDPDLDPNQQHWQDRLENFQWIVGSLVALLDSVPARPPAPLRSPVRPIPRSASWFWCC